MLALVIFLASLILRVFALFLKAMIGSKENPSPGVWIEANWGGLGGGLSGWRVSNAIIYLLLLSLLLGCLSLAVISLAPTPEKKGEPQKAEAQHEQKTEIPKKEDQKKDADQKPDAAQTPDASLGDKNLKKSSDAPAPGKKVEK